MIQKVWRGFRQYVAFSQMLIGVFFDDDDNGTENEENREVLQPSQGQRKAPYGSKESNDAEAEVKENEHEVGAPPSPVTKAVSHENFLRTLSMVYGSQQGIEASLKFQSDGKLLGMNSSGVEVRGWCLYAMALSLFSKMAHSITSNTVIGSSVRTVQERKEQKALDADAFLESLQSSKQELISNQVENELVKGKERAVGNMYDRAEKARRVSLAVRDAKKMTEEQRISHILSSEIEGVVGEDDYDEDESDDDDLHNAEDDFDVQDDELDDDDEEENEDEDSEEAEGDDDEDIDLEEDEVDDREEEEEEDDEEEEDENLEEEDEEDEDEDY